MSDLINRGAVIEVLKQTGIIQDNDLGHLVVDEINRIPTAYDVNKVVEELEEIRAKKTCNKEKCDTKEICRICVVDDAIEIVKRSCVYADVCEWKLEDEEANLYLTGCQQRQLIFDGTPKENGYRYCPYCGKKIKVVE